MTSANITERDGTRPNPPVLGSLAYLLLNLPLAAVGAMLLAVAVALTKALGSVHARYARAMLGPSQRRLAALERTISPSQFTWATP